MDTSFPICTSEDAAAFFSRFLKSLSSNPACLKIAAERRLLIRWELRNPDLTIIIDSRNGGLDIRLGKDETGTGKKIEIEFETFHKWMIGAIHLMIIWNRRQILAESDAAMEFFMALLPYMGRYYRAALNDLTTNTNN